MIGLLIKVLLFNKVYSIELETVFKEDLERTEADYTECLKRNEKMNSQSLGPTTLTHLVPISAVLRLECNHLCLDVNEPLDNIWVYMSLKSIKLDVRSNKNTKLLRDLSLEVKFGDQNESVIYYCIHNLFIHAVHQITVTDSEPFDLSYTKKPSNEIQVMNLDNGLQLFTQWSDWSDCNRCNKTGLKRRIGICKIRMNKIGNPLFDQSFNDSGIPCRSNFTNEGISAINEIQKEMSKIQFSFCRIKCRNESKVKLSKQLLDTKLDKFSQIAINSEIQLVFIGDKVVISCNIAFNATNHYVWRNYSTKSINFTNFADLKSIPFYYINPMRIHIKTEGRIKIDFMNNLVINYALISDQRLYRCYDPVVDLTISVTKLVVRSKVETITIWSGVKRYFSALLVVGTIILFGFSLYGNRKLKTKI